MYQNQRKEKILIIKTTKLSIYKNIEKEKENKNKK